MRYSIYASVLQQKAAGASISGIPSSETKPDVQKIPDLQTKAAGASTSEVSSVPNPSFTGLQNCTFNFYN